MEVGATPLLKFCSRTHDTSRSSLKNIRASARRRMPSTSSGNAFPSPAWASAGRAACQPRTSASLAARPCMLKYFRGASTVKSARANILRATSCIRGVHGLGTCVAGRCEASNAAFSSAFSSASRPRRAARCDSSSAGEATRLHDICKKRWARNCKNERTARPHGLGRQCFRATANAMARRRASLHPVSQRSTVCDGGTSLPCVCVCVELPR